MKKTFISHRLKISTTDEQINFGLMLLLNILDRIVHDIQFAMQATLDCNSHFSTLFLTFSVTFFFARQTMPRKNRGNDDASKLKFL